MSITALLAAACLQQADLRQDAPAAAPAAATQEVVTQDAATATSVELSYRAFRRFEFELPDERFAPIGDGFPIPHAGGEVFAAKVEGGALRVDATGDGTFAAFVEAPPPGETAVVTLRAPGVDGEEVRWCARVRMGRGGWEYACSGGLVGNVGDTKVVLFDQDLDGVYGEVGEDAIVLGRGRVAATMGSVLLIGDELFEASYADEHLELVPYTGETGVLDLRSGFETSGRPMSLRVSDHRNGLYFDLAQYPEGAPVPAGRYRFAGGQLASGANRVTIDRGRMERIEVEADERTVLEWGGPLRGEFEYAHAGTTYTFSPDAVWYYGRAGEQYVNWTPLGASPKFVIVDSSDRTELVSGVFPGS